MDFFEKEELEDLLGSVKTGLWKIEFIQDRKLFYADPVMDELLGTNASMTPEERSTFHFTHIHPDDLKIFLEYSASLITERSEIVYRYLHPTLGQLYVRCGGKCTLNDGDHMIFKGFHQDITNTIHVQNFTSNSDHTLSQITQILYGFNLTIDPYSGKFSLIRGTGMEETVQILSDCQNINEAMKRTSPLISREFRKKVKEIFDMERWQKDLASSGFIESITYSICYPNTKELHWHELNLFAEISSSGRHIFNILGRDVTKEHLEQEKKQRELQAAASNNRVLSELTKMLYSFNITVNTVSGKYSLIKGTGLEETVEVLQSTDDYLKGCALLLPMVDDKFKNKVSDLLKMDHARVYCAEKQGFIRSLEFLVHIKGKDLWHEANVFSGVNEQGERIFNVLGRDVTLAHEKAVTKTQLQVANAKNEAKTAFLFNMSHDIRTPMNAIIGFTELLERHQDDPVKRMDYIEKIKESSGTLLSIINNVLEMARIEKGTVTLNETICSMSRFETTFRSIFQDLMDNKGILFTSENHIIHDYVYVDSIRVREIFINILSNANKYTNHGGTVSLITKELPCEEKGYAIYQTSVSDTGIGMSKDFLPHIFEEFSREHTSTGNSVEGTGLGMPIVKRLVDMMGGTIEIQSTLGKGSTFIVTLKHRIAEKLDNEEIHESPASRYSTFKGKKILLAEDNDLNAEIAMEIISEAGLKIYRARDGLDCLNMVKEAEPGYYDLILMDIQMPNLNGYDATKEIRKLPDEQKASIPIIAMTANAFEEDRKNAVQAGMNGHLAKPIDVTKLISMLHEFLK